MKRRSKQIMAMMLALSMTVTQTGYVFAKTDGAGAAAESETIQVSAMAESEVTAETQAAIEAAAATVTEPGSEVIAGTEPESEAAEPESEATAGTKPESQAAEPESEAAAESETEAAQESEAATDTETESTEETESADTETEALFEISKIESKLAADDQICVSIYTEKPEYSKIYIGVKEAVEKTPEIPGILNELGGYTFTFELSADKVGQELTLVPYMMETEEWYVKEDVKFTVPEPEMLIADETMQNALSGEMEEAALMMMPMTLAVDDVSADIVNGDYATEVESSAAMFKVTNCVLTSKDGVYNAVITLSGTGYDYLYVGTAEAAVSDTVNWIPYVADADGKYTFTVPVADLDTPIAIAAHSAKKDTWYDRTLTFKSETMVKIPVQLEDGDYTTNVESNNKMFKVVNCVIHSKDGAMQAVITLSGTGYDYLYVGTAEAAAADTANWIPYVANADGQYTFTVPVEALDTQIPVAAHAVKSDSWKDRLLTFKSEGMEFIEGEADNDQPGSGENPDDGENPEGGGQTDGTENPEGGGQTDGTENPEGGEQTDDTEKPDDTTADIESKYESDLNGSTSRVDSSTALKDGVYAPDKFTWGGGSGRVSISCSKVTVKNGQAYATIVFDSDAYSYVKANGNKYYGSNSGGTSTFVIPVALNQNNTILGMTTKMSASHEVAYSIYVYIAGAEKSENTATGDLKESDTLSEEAPNVMGFEFAEEIQLDYAKYFKMYSYEQGVTLLEIDMKEGTGRTGEEVIEEAREQDGEAADTENAEETADTADVAGLYMNNVIKYLIVPEGVEVPVGLDKEVVVITLPADRIYNASEEVIELMAQLDALENIAAVDVEADECQVEALKTAMDNGEVVFAGTYDALDYKALVAEKINFAIMPDEMLPEGDVTLEESTEKLTVISEVSERLSLLGIPMLIDRSDDEEEKLAKLEWIKVYGILFGCEDAANQLFDEAVNAEK